MRPRASSRDVDWSGQSREPFTDAEALDWLASFFQMVDAGGPDEGQTDRDCYAEARAAHEWYGKRFAPPPPCAACGHSRWHHRSIRCAALDCDCDCIEYQPALPVQEGEK